ncbi:MAG TPA: DUF1684 domain-containing protein [Pseudonocardia sp.]
MTSTLIELQTEWDVWHTAREAELATPHGWLSLTSLNWLEAAPSPVDGLPGLWSASPDGVVLTASAAEGLVVRSVREPRPVDGTVTLHPVDGKPGTLIEDGDRLIEVARRTDAHVLRVRDPQAPTRTGFTGVPTFDVDGRWVLDAVFQPYVQPRTIAVGAVVEGLSHFPTAVGDVLFSVAGQRQRLVALQGKDGGLSLHFRDTTSGKSTYAGGRILFTGEPTPEGELTVDFNRTVNLPCAFTAYATCPLPPAGNNLTVAIEAGERLPARL